MARCRRRRCGPVSIPSAASRSSGWLNRSTGSGAAAHSTSASSASSTPSSADPPARVRSSARVGVPASATACTTASACGVSLASRLRSDPARAEGRRAAWPSRPPRAAVSLATSTAVYGFPAASVTTRRSSPGDHCPGNRVKISSDTAASPSPARSTRVRRGPSSCSSTRTRPRPTSPDRTATSQRTGAPLSRAAATSSSRRVSASTHCSSSTATTTPPRASPRSTPTTARSGKAPAGEAPGAARPSATRSAVACGGGSPASTVAVTGSSRSARLASAACATGRPVVRSTSASAEHESATARHRVVLPIPAGPTITTATASARPPESAARHTASSGPRPSKLTTQSSPKRSTRAMPRRERAMGTGADDPRRPAGRTPLMLKR